MSVPPTEPFRVPTNSEPLRLASEGLPALPPPLFVGHTLAFLVRWFLECPAGSYLCGFCRCPLRPHSDTCLRPLVTAQSSLKTLLWGPSLLRCLPWPPYHSFTICVCHPHPVWCCEDLFHVHLQAAPQLLSSPSSSSSVTSAARGSIHRLCAHHLSRPPGCAISVFDWPLS